MNDRLPLVKLTLCGLLWIALTACATAADANTDALKQKVIAHARTVTEEDYSFTRTIRVEQIEGDKTEQRVVIDRWDPGKPPNQRWSLVSIDGHAPKAEEQKAYTNDNAKRRVPNYGRIGVYLASSSTTSVDAKGRTVYHFAALPKDTVVVAGSDVSSNASAEATVNASGDVPFVEETRFTLTKPFRIKLVAKVERFEAKTRYRFTADGKVVPAEQSAETSGSMLGKQGRIRTTITYSDQHLVRR